MSNVNNSFSSPGLRSLIGTRSAADGTDPDPLADLEASVASSPPDFAGLSAPPGRSRPSALSLPSVNAKVLIDTKASVPATDLHAPSPAAAVSVLKSRGVKEGESDLDSLLSDTRTLGAPKGLKKEEMKPPVYTGTPKSSVRYTIELFTKAVMKETCGGPITSKKGNYFCAKKKTDCGIGGHDTDHPEFIENTVYLISFNPASSTPGLSRKAVEPQLHSINILDMNVEYALTFIEETNKAMIKSKDNLSEVTAIAAYKKFEMKLMEGATYNSKITDNKTKTKALLKTGQVPKVKLEKVPEQSFDMDAEMAKAQAEYELELKNLAVLEEVDTKEEVDIFEREEQDYVIWKDRKQDFTVDVGDKWRVEGALSENPTYDLMQKLGQQNLAQAVEVIDDEPEEMYPVEFVDKFSDDKHSFQGLFQSFTTVLADRGELDPSFLEYTEFLDDRSSLDLEIYRLFVLFNLQEFKDKVEHDDLIFRLKKMNLDIRNIEGTVTEDVIDTLKQESQDWALRQWDDLVDGKIDNLTRDVTKAVLNSKMFQSMVQKVSARVPLQKSLPQSGDCSKHGCCNKLRIKVNALEDRVEKLEKDHLSIRDMQLQCQVMKTAMGVWQKDFQAMESRLTIQDALIAAQGTDVSILQNEHLSLTTDVNYVTTNAASKSVVQDTNKKLSGLTHDLVMMNSRLRATSINFGGVQLDSLADALLFSNDKITNRSFGGFVDLIALMDSPRDAFMDEKSFLNSLYNAQKTAMLSPSEVSTSASFLRVAPKCFGGKTDESMVHGSVGKMLPAVKSREKWSSNGGMFGLKKDISSSIGEQVITLQAEIDATLTGEAKSLATAYLSESFQCFNEFVTWTESFFYELQSMASVEEDEAWTLILKCWLAFFIELRKIRMQCSAIPVSGHDNSRRVEMVGKYVYVMGLAIQKQNEFRDKSFRNHPTISTVINYYLFEHRVSTAVHNKNVKSLKSDITALNTWKATAVRDIKRALG